MTGYRVYCFPGDSGKAEIIKDIHDGKQESVIVSGLKPDKRYRIGITSVSSETESKLVICKEQPRLRKFDLILNSANICSFKCCTPRNLFCFISAGIHHVILDQNLTVLKQNLIHDEVVEKMLENDSSMMEYVFSTKKQEEQIQRFIECLQNSSLKDYDNFIKLLYITKQQPLITKLVSSCKIILALLYIILILNLTI